MRVLHVNAIHCTTIFKSCVKIPLNIHFVESHQSTHVISIGPIERTLNFKSFYYRFRNRLTKTFLQYLNHKHLYIIHNLKLKLFYFRIKYNSSIELDGYIL